MTKDEKVGYYLRKLSHGMTDESVSEFLFDFSQCPYNGDMFCPMCSNGCFKQNVFGMLTDYEAALLNKAMFKVYYDKKSED